MAKIIKGVIWGFGILLVLSNLGINISSLLAGLGIGGIAVALALQNILGDLFSAFAIYLDKPFEVGDFIVVGESKGTVEKIGIKTSRLRALQGEELIISNKELTNARIQNFKKMKERRITFRLGVTYETPLEKLKKIPEIIKQIITSFEDTRFERAHFVQFGDFALIFEVVYYMTTPAYIDYLNTQEKINFKIKEIFEKENIEMAYPTQTIFLKKT